jgi:hypothetical protein
VLRFPSTDAGQLRRRSPGQRLLDTAALLDADLRDKLAGRLHSALAGPTDRQTCIALNAVAGHLEDALALLDRLEATFDRLIPTIRGGGQS